VEEPSVAEKVRMLESIFRKLIASAMGDEPSPLSGEDLGNLNEVASFRGLWLEVKGLEDAEEGYREQAAMAARFHGQSTARLVMAGIEGGSPNVFILTCPTLGKTSEQEIANGLQKAVQTMLGGVLMEHEMLKSTMAAVIMKTGEHLGGTIHLDLHDLAKAMRELDFETMAAILGLEATAVDGNPEASTS